MNLIDKIQNWRVGLNLERFAGTDLAETTFREAWLESRTGKKIYAHIHHPSALGRYPGLVVVPGADSPGTDYDRGVGIRAEDLASCGFTVLHYDPSGRGRTGGSEDYWGPIHQQELSSVIDSFSKLPEVAEENIGLLSFSIGIVIASGALARFTEHKIKYLFDWEGPSNRFNTIKNDTHKPLIGFPTSNDVFWREREAASFIGNIECWYFRYQAEIDHVQGKYKGHAVDLLNRATRGRALLTKCNNNPANTIFDENKTGVYRWVPSGLNHKGQIIRYLLELQSEPCIR